MQTVLDTGYSWFLDNLVYKDKLEIYILEGVLSDEPKELKINGHSVGNAYSLGTTKTSRRFVIIFEEILTYNIIQEPYTFANDYEIRTKGIFCKYERSYYLDFIMASTLVESLKSKQYTHYGLTSENHIIDVISIVEPKILQL